MCYSVFIIVKGFCGPLNMKFVISVQFSSNGIEKLLNYCVEKIHLHLFKLQTFIQINL